MFGNSAVFFLPYRAPEEDIPGDMLDHIHKLACGLYEKATRGMAFSDNEDRKINVKFQAMIGVILGLSEHDNSPRSKISRLVDMIIFSEARLKDGQLLDEDFEALLKAIISATAFIRNVSFFVIEEQKATAKLLEINTSVKTSVDNKISPVEEAEAKTGFLAKMSGSEALIKFLSASLEKGLAVDHLLKLKTETSSLTVKFIAPKVATPSTAFLKR